jgi:hypothetical protein
METNQGCELRLSSSRRLGSLKLGPGSVNLRVAENIRKFDRRFKKRPGSEEAPDLSFLSSLGALALFQLALFQLG